MSETSPYMTAIPGPSADYRFVPANNDIVEEAEIYENIAFPKQTPNNPQRAGPVLTSFQQSNKTQENDFNKFNRVFIMIALALIMGWALAACGLGMAIQARNQLAQVQDEVSKLSHELYVEQSERKNATHRQDGLAKIRDSALLDVQQKLDSFSKKDDLMILRHDNLAGSVNSTFRVFQANLDAFSEKHGSLIHNQDKFAESMNSSFVLFQQNLDVLLQKNDFLTHRQNNLNLTMVSSFSDIQKQVDLSLKLSELQAVRQNQSDKLVDSTFLKFYQTFSLTNGIRLVNGNSSAGRVEIYHNGVWGTICDDVIDYDAGNLMCRLLGFNGATTMYSSAHYGPGSGTIWLDDLSCSGTETTLGDCSHLGWGAENCIHNEDLSIACS